MVGNDGGGCNEVIFVMLLCVCGEGEGGGGELSIKPSSVRVFNSIFIWIIIFCTFWYTLKIFRCFSLVSLFLVPPSPSCFPSVFSLLCSIGLRGELLSRNFF